MNATKMTRLLVLLAVASAATVLFAQGQGHTYSTAEARNHIGEFASVVGIVEQVSTSSKGTEFLNFDGKYPDAPFTAVVFASDTATVGNVTQYEGKRVTVTGKITLYHGTPEVIVKSASALKSSQ